jgi:hypothetical protein
MPLILGTNSIKDVGYDVDNSCRFAHDGDDKLDRTTETPTLGTKFTVSFWCKRDNLGDYHHILTTTANPGNWDSIRFSNGDKLQVLLNNETANYTTTRLFRDVSAWYHIVVRVDTTDATAGDRLKIYVNGVEETSFSTETHPAQNHTFNYQTSGKTVRIGANTWNTATGHEKLGGYLCEFCFIDGQALDADQFGEFDQDSGIWKPIDVSSLTFGDNGWYLDFKDSSSLGNDVSGNNNDFTSSGLTSIDQTTDTCTNNFATFNNLLGSNRQGSQLTFSEGNCKVQDSGGSNDPYIPSTIGVTKGKWYAELKLDAYTEDGHAFGIAATDGDFSESTANLFCILQYATKAGDNLPRIYNFGDVSVDDQADNNPGDIIGCAVDIDNGTVDFTVNGSAYASQVTGLSSNFSGKTIFFIIRGEGGGSRTFTSSINFGSPSFSISSGNSDGNGYGNFEYSVPSGYYALNTKNLAEYG